mmetsp:Transcript_3243/g.7727  ORF Transcript_3243/g.7727 Transcript_3243/m.7727 type:complete len:383 (-) Transcript_3243:199-1347(-)
MPVHRCSPADDCTALESSGELAGGRALPGVNLRAAGNRIQGVALHASVERLVHEEKVLRLLFLAVVEAMLAGEIAGGSGGGHHQHVLPAGPVLNRRWPTSHGQALLRGRERAVLLARLLKGPRSLGSAIQGVSQLALEPHGVREVHIRSGVAGVRDVGRRAAVLRHASGCPDPGPPAEHQAIAKLLALNLVVIEIVPRHAIHWAIRVLGGVAPLAHGLGVGDRRRGSVALLSWEVVTVVHLVNSGQLLATTDLAVVSDTRQITMPISGAGLVVEVGTPALVSIVNPKILGVRDLLAEAEAYLGRHLLPLALGHRLVVPGRHVLGAVVKAPDTKESSAGSQAVLDERSSWGIRVILAPCRWAERVLGLGLRKRPVEQRNMSFV